MASWMRTYAPLPSAATNRCTSSAPADTAQRGMHSARRRRIATIDILDLHTPLKLPSAHPHTPQSLLLADRWRWPYKCMADLHRYMSKSRLCWHRTSLIEVPRDLKSNLRNGGGRRRLLEGAGVGSAQPENGAECYRIQPQLPPRSRTRKPECPGLSEKLLLSP